MDLHAPAIAGVFLVDEFAVRGRPAARQQHQGRERHDQPQRARTPANGRGGQRTGTRPTANVARHAANSAVANVGPGTAGIRATFFVESRIHRRFGPVGNPGGRVLWHPMACLYLNTFAPLACTADGLDASERYGLPPFIDGSIRREPDFEHARPAITCLCRGGKFAPRLVVGDVVAYMTIKAAYRSADRHRRLVALLEVTDRFDSHAEAADWYRSNGLNLPNNLMVAGNVAHPLSHSHRRHHGCKRGCGSDSHVAWDREYADRATRFGRVVTCQPRYVDTGWDASIIHDEDLQSVFGRMPGTENPGAIPLDYIKPLMQRLQIDVQPSCP